MGRTHDLKTWPAYFAAILDGSKTFEVRNDDRGILVGDTLLLREWSPDSAAYTGRSINVVVTYKLAGGAFGVAPGTCVMGFRAPCPSCAELRRERADALATIATLRAELDKSLPAAQAWEELDRRGLSVLRWADGTVEVAERIVSVCGQSKSLYQGEDVGERALDAVLAAMEVGK